MKKVMSKDIVAAPEDEETVDVCPFCHSEWQDKIVM